MADKNTVGGSDDGVDRSDCEVRLATRLDIKYIKFLCDLYRADNDWTQELIYANLGNFFVEGSPVHGFVMALPHENKLLLTLIVVHEYWRKKGVATRLLEAMEEVARAAGLEGVMNFGPKTPEVRKLYDKLGYKEIGKKEWPGLPDADILFKEV